MKTKISNKYKNTVVVDVLEDFNPIKSRSIAEKKETSLKGRVVYAKGTQQAIQKNLLKKLKVKGLKCKEVSIDFEKKHEDARKALMKKRKSLADE